MKVMFWLEAADNKPINNNKNQIILSTIQKNKTE